jgi:hypothetical protein
LLTKALLTHDEIVLLYAVPLELKQGRVSAAGLLSSKPPFLTLTELTD